MDVGTSVLGILRIWRNERCYLVYLASVRLYAGGGGSVEHISKDYSLSGCTRLAVIGLKAAAVNISAHDCSDVMVTATGAEQRLSELKIYANNGAAMVCMDAKAIAGEKLIQHTTSCVGRNVNRSINIGRGNVVRSVTQVNGVVDIDGQIFSGSNVSITNGVVRVDGKLVSGAPMGLKTVDIKVPEGTKISLFNLFAETTIEGVNGDLEVMVDTPEDVFVDRVKNLTATLRSTGNLTIGSIDGDAIINIGSAGDLEIGSGKVGHLWAHVDGTGDLEINATVGSGDLVTTSVGSIYIAKVLGRITQRCTGSGRINIG